MYNILLQGHVKIKCNKRFFDGCILQKCTKQFINILYTTFYKTFYLNRFVITRNVIISVTPQLGPKSNAVLNTNSTVCNLILQDQKRTENKQ